MTTALSPKSWESSPACLSTWTGSATSPAVTNQAFFKVSSPESTTTQTLPVQPQHHRPLPGPHPHTRPSTMPVNFTHPHTSWPHPHTRPSTTNHPTTRDKSIFGGGENLIHFTHFTSLWVLALSLYVLVGHA